MAIGTGDAGHDLPYPVGMDVPERWERSSRLLADHRDIIDATEDHAPPAWAARRGWLPWLEARPDAFVDAADAAGLAALLDAAHDAPDDLRALGATVRALTDLPLLAGEPAWALDPRRAAPRKRAQVLAFAALTAPLARDAHRIVDVGAGHGHLTRHLAEAFAAEAIGIERDHERVAVATGLAAGRVRFEAVDALTVDLALRPEDLVLGLHACGALTDRLARAAAEGGAAAAWVSCCLQRLHAGAVRAPLVTPPVGEAALTLAVRILGLSNAAPQAHGVEADLSAIAEARARREGLRVLLELRGVVIHPGEELRGVNRRRSHDPLSALAARVLAGRGLSAPTPTELSCATAEGATRWAARRRYALPRRMLGPLVELYVNLDRALLLLRAGHAVEVGRAFPADLSPRNLAVRAGRRAPARAARSAPTDEPPPRARRGEVA